MVCGGLDFRVCPITTLQIVKMSGTDDNYMKLEKAIGKFECGMNTAFDNTDMAQTSTVLIILVNDHSLVRILYVCLQKDANNAMMAQSSTVLIILVNGCSLVRI